MEVKELPGLALMLVLVGMIVGIGVLITSQFGAVVYVDTAITNETVVWPATGATVALTFHNVTAVTQILNDTGGAEPTANYTIDLTSGVITNDGNTSACTQGDDCYVYYTFRNYETATKVALDSAGSAISGIATSWLALIITIAVLAILLVLVIRSFSAPR